MLKFLRRIFETTPPQPPEGSPAAMRLQGRIVQQIASELPPEWTRYNIHYEYFVHEGATFEKYISVCHSAAGKADYHPSMDALDLLQELHNTPVNNSGEKWTHLDCEFDRSGKYEFKFSYGVPPLAAKSIELAKRRS